MKFMMFKLEESDTQNSPSSEGTLNRLDHVSSPSSEGMFREDKSNSYSDFQIAEAFKVQLNVKGTLVEDVCYPSWTVLDFLSKIVTNLDVEYEEFLASGLTTADGSVTISNSTVISDVLFIQMEIRNNNVPLLIPVNIQTKTKRSSTVTVTRRRSTLRRSVIGLDHKLVMPTNPQIDYMFNLPSGLNLLISLDPELTIAEIKNEIAKDPRQNEVSLSEISKFLIKIPGAGFLLDELAVMTSIPYVSNCMKKLHGNSKIQFVLLPKISQRAKQYKVQNLEIGSLIGRPLSWTQQDDETTAFRQSMCLLRHRLRSNDSETGSHNGIEVHVTKGPIDLPNGKTRVSVMCESGLVLSAKKKTVEALETDTADEFFLRFYQKYLAHVVPTKTEADFVFKVTGLADYITGPHKFHHFDHIRDCLAKGKPIELSVVDIESSRSSSYDFDDNDENLIIDPEITYDHNKITVSANPFKKMRVISVWDLQREFRLRIVGVENLNPNTKNFFTLSGRASSYERANIYLYIRAGLYHGGELIMESLYETTHIPSTSNPRWFTWADTKINTCDIPREARLCFTLWGGRRKQEVTEKDLPLAWVNCQLFDYKHELRTGVVTLNMWPDDEANPIGTCVQNYDNNSPTLSIEFETYKLPVVFPTERTQVISYPKPAIIPSIVQQTLEKIVNMDPMYRMTQKDKHLVWKCRESLVDNPKALPKFLSSVPKTDRHAIQEMYRLLELWAPIDSIDALELLDSSHADSKIRKYAVHALGELTPEDILDYLLQLVQVIKYEPHHNSYLVKFLLAHAFENRNIAHTFFWYLKSEMHVEEIADRYGLILEAYLRGCGSHRSNLQQQDEIQKKFIWIANYIKQFSKPSEKMEKLRDQIGKITFEASMQIPLNPKIVVKGIQIDRCKYMDSKMMPLWIVFENADPQGKEPAVIFKSGDDLRQDMLTLQLIRLMDKLWRKHNLDFKMNTYGCISTGNEVGMIEVVQNSKTCASITKAAGGASAAFREDPIANWLRQNNKTDTEYKRSVENFVLSCAGYCVATYVLGVGDRHNDNVMITYDGCLFHIDFGHFLGNYKKKFGVKRERAPFVFTPDFAFVMGGKDSPHFKKFIDYCCKAYNILRTNANLFINLCAMMLSTGIPELQTAKDIEYLRGAFSHHLSEEQAAEKFTKLIYGSLATKTTQWNNAFHILAH